MFRKECYGAFMAVAYRRGLTRIAGGFFLVFITALSGPLALADQPAQPERMPNGLVCTDEMETEPDYDDLDPTDVADTVDADSCQSSSGAPVAI